MAILAFVMVTALCITTAEAQTRVSLQVFYDELQPYGTWVHYGSRGYVWIPRVDRGFVPYATNGYWMNTDYGNTWVSDYAWGWAPFHYGRWLFDDFSQRSERSEICAGVSPEPRHAGAST